MLLITGLILTNRSQAKSLSTEIALLDSKYIATGIFTSQLSKNEKFGLTLLGRYESSYLKDYSKNMLIAYTGYKVVPSLHVLGGLYYSYPSTPAPVVALQYFYVRDHFTVMLFPNLIVDKHIVLLNFLSMEYHHHISDHLNWFLRFEPYMVSGLRDHYFTSLKFRAGIGGKKLKGGLTSENEFSGNEFTFQPHLGIFLQYQIL